MKQHTDVGLAVDAIAATIQQHQDCKADIVIVITDFRNDEKGSGEHKLDKKTIERISNAVKSACTGRYTRFVAVELPVNAAAPGYCLPQLREDVFNFDGKYLEVVSASQSEQDVKDWFERLRRDIMVTKLRAVIDDANRLSPADLDLEISIDGDVNAEVNWTPTKLYPSIKVDSSYLLGDDFCFVNYTENFLQTTEPRIEVVKHKSFGLHYLKDTLNLGLTLPTEYDNELSRLGVNKPLPDTRREVGRLAFTFFLPFWLTVCLAILLLIYLLMVFKAIARNSAERFVGTVDILNGKGKSVGPTIDVKAKPSQTILIGNGGNCGCDVVGANWTIKLVKVKPSPFLVWERPAFEWSAKEGIVRFGKRKRGLISRYNKKNTRKRVEVECLPTNSEVISHYVTIKIK